tara:strand:+ start:392 stop:898 length:507 start_codon:yes stop_codon:yes gene_type:complete
MNLAYCENGELTVFDTETNAIVEWQKKTGKDETPKWRISTANGYRCFAQKDIDSSLLRKKMAETPIGTLQKRNNVEATIFQLGYHCPNNKTRYRGEIKHQMWANVRCVWVNFVRTAKYLGKLNAKTVFAIKLVEKSAAVAIYLALNLLFKAIKDLHSAHIRDFQFSWR